MTTLSPLSERIDAPHRLALPIHPDIALWRPLEPADAPAIAALHGAADALDHPGWTVPESELHELLSRSYLDLRHDSLAAVTDDGTVVAYGLNLIDQEPRTILRVRLEGAIGSAARGRGIGRELLQWQRGRAQQQLAASGLDLPGWIIAWESARNISGIRLFELLGFHAARFTATLVRELTAPVTPITAHESIRIVPFSRELSAATHAAHGDAFRDHWSSQPSHEEAWAGFVNGPALRPELSFVAVDAAQPDLVVGYALTSVFEHDFERQGFSSSYIELVGTRRDWRGKRIAPALIARVLEASRGAGLDKAVLDVDTQTPSSAAALYAELGFAVAEDRQVAMLLAY